MLFTHQFSLVTRLGVSATNSVLSVVKSVCFLVFLLPLFFVPWCLGGSPPVTEYHGEITFGGLPMPGATVTATQGAQQLITSSDLQGLFSFPGLAAGKWTIEIQMTGFATVKQDVTIGPNTPPGKWELKLLPLGQIKAQVQPGNVGVGPGQGAAHGEGGGVAVGVAPGLSPAPPIATETEKSAGNKSAGLKPGVTNTEAAKKDARGEEEDQRAANGFLINGSEMNGASSPFAQSFAFGNHRGGRGLYTGGLSLIFDNSALDARPYSLTGQNTPKPAYNRITGIATLGGPLRIPHLLRIHAPNVFAAYEWTRSVNATTQSSLVPTAAERGGDFSQVLSTLGQPAQIFDPATGLPFAGNVIPQGQISPQAKALLNFYPSPTFGGNPRYNYQTAIVDNTHQDALAIALQ